MYRILLGTGLLLCGLFQQEAFLRAQEPAFISGDGAVRFEQAPGFFHYAALCRTATEFSAAIPPARLPRESTESAVCWYVKATKMRNDGGKVDGSPMVDGKLVISAHHVRFIPHDPQFADLYVDFHPEETELMHQPGQPFAAVGTTKVLVGFRFSKLCLTCAPGTPIPAGTVPALLDQEFQLVQEGIKHFDAGYRRIYALSAKIRVENAKSIVVPPAKANTTASATPNTVSPPKPSASPAERHVAVATTTGVAVEAKPSTTAPAKPSTPSAAKPDSAPAEKLSTVATAKPAAANVGTVAAAKAGTASVANPAPVPAETTVVASANPNPSSPAKPGALPAEKLGVTPPARTGDGPVKPAVASATPSAITFAAVKPAVPSGKSNAIVATPSSVPDPPVAPPPQPAGSTLKIAPGTAEGLLVKKVPPAYPLEAKVARVQGTVTLNVTISKTGAVTAVDVVSGPDLLQSAAVDAVKQWEFRPFSLVGEPVEFETTVHVVFGVGGPPQRVQAQGHP